MSVETWRYSFSPKIAALETNEVSRKAMDAKRDKKMDLLQAVMAGLKLQQEANFAYKKSTFTTSLPVMTHVAQPPNIVHPNTQEHPETTFSIRGRTT